MSKIQDNELSKLFNIRRTLFEMLIDRGYVVDHKEVEETFPEWKEKFRNRKDSMSMYSTKENDLSSTIYVEFMDEKKLNLESVSDFSEKIKSKNTTCGIMINWGQLTPMAKQKLKDLNEIFHIEYFEEDELVVNITKHELVPKHILLTDDEKKQLLKK
jgi:DNA-directed RNA polymerase I, II, and III subunit RPABC1